MPDEIGTLFHQASAPAMSVDPYAVLSGGRRRRQRRRLAAVAGTAAATLVLGVGGWTALSRSTGEEETLPATTSSASFALPEPVAELSLGVIPQTAREQPLVAAVAVDDGGEGLQLALRTEAGSVIASRPVALGRTEKARWATLIPGVTVAVLPAGATGAAPVWTDGSTARGSASTQMPDGRVLVAWWTDGSSLAPFTNVAWTDGESAYTADDVELSTFVQDGHLFFAGAPGGLVGHLPPPATEGFGHGEAKAAKDVAEGTHPAVWAAADDGSGGTYAVYLPPVQDVRLLTSDGAAVRDLTVHELPGKEEILVLARVDGDRESISEVRYSWPGTDYTGGPASAS